MEWQCNGGPHRIQMELVGVGRFSGVVYCIAVDVSGNMHRLVENMLENLMKHAAFKDEVLSENRKGRTPGKHLHITICKQKRAKLQLPNNRRELNSVMRALNQIRR